MGVVVDGWRSAQPVLGLFLINGVAMDEAENWLIVLVGALILTVLAYAFSSNPCDGLTPHECSDIISYYDDR
jgi:hypothetical protein